MKPRAPIDPRYLPPPAAAPPRTPIPGSLLVEVIEPVPEGESVQERSARRSRTWDKVQQTLRTPGVMLAIVRAKFPDTPTPVLQEELAQAAKRAREDVDSEEGWDFRMRHLLGDFTRLEAKAMKFAKASGDVSEFRKAVQAMRVAAEGIVDLAGRRSARWNNKSTLTLTAQVEGGSPEDQERVRRLTGPRG